MSNLPTSTVEALATQSTSVHIRTASGSAAPTQYITSSPNSIPIQNLAQGLELNSNLPVAAACGYSGSPASYEQNCSAIAAEQEAPWTVVGDPGGVNAEYDVPDGGDLAPTILDFGCAITGEVWPDVYHACDNGADGFHLTGGIAVWNYSEQGSNQSFEVYVR